MKRLQLHQNIWISLSLILFLASLLCSDLLLTLRPLCLHLFLLFSSQLLLSPVNKSLSVFLSLSLSLCACGLFLSHLHLDLCPPAESESCCCVAGSFLPNSSSLPSPHLHVVLAASPHFSPLYLCSLFSFLEVILCCCHHLLCCWGDFKTQTSAVVIVFSISFIPVSV